MPNLGSSEVGQRRFWNNIPDREGVIFIGSYGGLERDGCLLWASHGGGWSVVYTGAQLASGPQVFPPRWKGARFWKMTWDYSTPAGGSSDWDGTNQWIFKPYSTDLSQVGPERWQMGSDWRSNLFYDSSPWAIPTTLHYKMTCEASSVTTGFGGAGLAYGYLNDVYFGHNEMGGGKENVGIGPKSSAVGDLSKTFPGFWGSFGISHGVATSDYSVHAEWVFDLCWRPEAAAMMSLNGQMSHLNPPNDNQTEGWGTDIVPVQEVTIEKSDGSLDNYLQFTVDVSAARDTMSVYTIEGKQLMYGTDYVHDSCDKSGRSYRLRDGALGVNVGGTADGAAIASDPCKGIYRLIVTYLVVATVLSIGKRTPRQIDTNVGHNRLGPTMDPRGL